MNNCNNHQNCQKQALIKAEEICETKGLRFTALRKKVLKLIWQSHSPTKAYDLLDFLKEDNNSSKPPTIYRALHFLLDNGLIHKLNSLNSYVGCSHPLTNHQCQFLICSKCQEVQECCNNDLNQAINKTLKNYDFSSKKITIEIDGKCKKCKN